MSKVIILKRTYVQIMTMPSKKFKKPSYHRTLLLQVQRSKSAKNRDLHTLSSTLQLSSHFICRYVTYIYITSFLGDMQILSATLPCLTKGGGGMSNCKFWGKKPSSSFNYYKRMRHKSVIPRSLVSRKTFCVGVKEIEKKLKWNVETYF